MHGIEGCLFGSAVVDDQPRDIDILLIYDPEQFSVDHSIGFRRRIRELLTNATGLLADIVLLSIREAEETRFLDQIHAVPLLTESGAVDED